MTNPMNKAIQLALDQTRNPHEVSLRSGVALGLVRRYMRTCPMDYLEGWGKVSLQSSIISRRSEARWPVADKAVIERMHLQHDSGHVNICQGRDGDYFLLYATPNVKPVKRAPYFTRRVD
jgi:hypothetical protein